LAAPARKLVKGEEMMKKLALPLTLLLAGALLLTPAVTATSRLPIFLNGHKAPVEGVLIDGSTYVPLRYLSEALGAKVDYRDGQVFVETGQGVPAAPGVTLTAEQVKQLPTKRLTEKIAQDKIEYAITGISYSTRGNTTYTNLQLMETSSIHAYFGTVPTIAYQLKDGTIGVLKDFNLTADKDLNAKWRRTFTLEFVSPGQVQYYIYIPGNTGVPIGKWSTY